MSVKLSDIMDRGLLEQHLKDGYVSRQYDAWCEMVVFNYSQRAQWEKKWDEVTLQCRGLVVDVESDIVLARPFRKFFNLSEMETTPSVPYRVFNKMDGSLGIGIVPGVIATRGSFQSPQAQAAMQIWARQYSGVRWPSGITPLWEIIHPVSKVVVDYRGVEDLVLLATIDIETGKDTHDFAWWPGPVVLKHPVMPIEKLASITGSEAAFQNEEGFVILWDDGTRAKVKYGEYLRLHKLVTGVSALRVWDILRKGESMEELLDRVPDEFYRWITQIRDDLHAAYAEVELAARTAYAAQPAFKTRKDFALWVQSKHSKIAPLMFALLDGDDYSFSKHIWKTLRPDGSVSLFKEDNG